MSRQAFAAVVAAVGAAFFYALSNVYQQREAEQIADEHAIKLGILGQLARRPRWWIGMGSDVGGYVFEALALGAGSLMLVEPILSTSLLLSLLLSSLIHHRRIARAGWVAAIALASGVSLFLYRVAPTGGDQVAPVNRWIAIGVPAAAIIVLCVAAARLAVGVHRATLLGCAAGTAFGVSAVLTKAFVHYLGNGIFAWVDHWEPYGLAVFAIGGLVCSQSAFQTGSLPAAVGAEQVMQPLVGVALGANLLHEQLSASSAAGIATIGLAVTAMVFGVVALARFENTEAFIGSPTTGVRRLTE